MTSRWFHQVATVLALAAFVAVPAASPVWAAKTKPAAAGKLVQPKENALTTPPPAILGGIDTQAKHVLVLEADTGAVNAFSLGCASFPAAVGFAFAAKAGEAAGTAINAATARTVATW